MGSFGDVAPVGSYHSSAMIAVSGFGAFPERPLFANRPAARSDGVGPTCLMAMPPNSARRSARAIGLLNADRVRLRPGELPTPRPGRIVGTGRGEDNGPGPARGR